MDEKERSGRRSEGNSLLYTEGRDSAGLKSPFFTYPADVPKKSPWDSCNWPAQLLHLQYDFLYKVLFVYLEKCLGFVARVHL
jgi:hypothetical protein